MIFWSKNNPAMYLSPLKLPILQFIQQLKNEDSQKFVVYNGVVCLAWLDIQKMCFLHVAYAY